MYFSEAFFEGLLIFGGAYVRREICVSKSIGLACSGKEMYHFCFVLLYIRGQILSISPGGAISRRVSCVTNLRGLYLEGRIHGGAYFRNFTVTDSEQVAPCWYSECTCQDGHLIEVQPYTVTEKVSSFFS